MLIGELIFNTSLFQKDIEQVLENLRKLGYVIKGTQDWNAFEIYTH